MRGGRDGLITPTDVDGMIEYHDEVFIFYELKLAGVNLPDGQRKALKNLVDALIVAGKRAVLFKCEHWTREDEDINASTTEVTAIYLGNGVVRNGCGRSLKRETDDFLRYSPVRFGDGEEPQWN